MEKINFKKDKIPFTQVANEVLNDSNLSAKAKGLYAYLYSKPEGWDFAIDRIAKSFSDGRASINRGLGELEKNGYLLRQRQPTGRMIYLLQSQMTKSDIGDYDTQKPHDQKCKVLKVQSAKTSTVSNKDREVIKNISNKETKNSFSHDDLVLAELLRDEIKSNIPTFKDPNLEVWAKHVRLMRERDNRTIEQIEFLIKWCQKDHFWQANILSTKKLREKFDQLVAQVKRKATTINKTKVAFH